MGRKNDDKPKWPLIVESLRHAMDNSVWMLRARALEEIKRKEKEAEEKSNDNDL